MADVLWTGRLTPRMAFISNINNVVWWALGRHRDGKGMKNRVRRGYDADFLPHVQRYDELCADINQRIAAQCLDGVEVVGLKVLDVGAGTGITTRLALDAGAATVVCTDASSRMLAAAEANLANHRAAELVDYRQADAEALPFEDDSFDVTISGLLLGLVPDQTAALREMARVTRSGGLVVAAAQGREYLWEAIDASARSIPIQYVLGHRFEFWPHSEEAWCKLFERSGLKVDASRSLRFVNEFDDGAAASDFFTTISSGWWYDHVPENRRQALVDRTIDFFCRKEVKRLTEDVVIVLARPS